MNTLEDQVRSATRATAAEIEPGSIGPLSLARRQLHHELPRWLAPGRPSRGRTRWQRLLAPAAAAAAVVAMVAAALAVTHIAHQPGGSRLPAGAVPLAAPTSGTGTPAIGLPPYYVSLEPGPLSGNSTRAVVRATATGKALATVTPPRPFLNFSEVTAAADDRTFVLAADDASKEKCFLLRLDPANGAATLSAPPIPDEPAGHVVDIALAPDGSKLAIASEPGNTEVEITVISLETGAARTWEGPIQGSYYISGVVQTGNALSWTADGQTLAFEQEAVRGNRQSGPETPSIQVRLLDTAAPGDDLWSSRAVAISGNATNAMITPDGTRIVAPVDTQTTRGVAEYSARTGRLLAVLGIRHFRNADYGGGPALFWTNPSGSTVIVHDAKAGSPLLTSNGGLTPFVLAKVTGSQFTPLPGSDSWGAW